MSGESGLPEAWGQCATCAHARSVGHPREGEAYCRCALAETDSRFKKYPRLPMLNCPGFTLPEPHHSK